MRHQFSDNPGEVDRHSVRVETSQQAYALAREVAMDELDCILPEAKKLSERIRNLRAVIHCLSDLLNVDVPEAYELEKITIVAPKRRSR